MITETMLRKAEYTLSEEQDALRDAFADFFETQCPTARVRGAEPHGFDEDLWRRLVDLRAVAMGLPEHVGGDGAGLVELAVVAEQFGKRLAPAPLIEAVVAARALAAVAPSPGDGVLTEAIDGTKLLTLALHPGTGPQLVPAAAVADTVVGLVDDALVLTTSTEPRRRPANQGYTPLAWWDQGGATGTVRLASGAHAVEVYEQSRREWKLLMAAALVGMAEAVLGIGVEHARSRVAFGAPIGTYQAVSHALADVAMGVETARRLVGKACWFSDHEPAVERQLAPMAYLYTEEMANRATTVGVHVLGGVGFTVESDAQLYFRRVKGWTLPAGDPLSELAGVADELFGERGV